MPTDDILIRFKADTGQLKAEFEQVKKSLSGVNTEQKKIGDQQKKNADQVKTSTKEITAETEKLKAGNSALGTSFAKLGALITAAFSIQQIISFGNTAVAEFAKAEKSAFQLLGALNGNTGAQKRLLDLAKQFQQRFGIDNDVIVAQESFLAIQGRTETQIKKTIQAAIQLSAVTGEDLGSAVQKLDGTFEGITGRLGKLDSRINDLSKSQLANGDAIDIINEKYAGFAEKGLEGTAGQLQRIQVETDEASKKIGESLAPIKLFFVEATKDIIDFFSQVIGGFSDFINGKSDAAKEIQKFREQQTSLALKSFDNFNKEKLEALKAADERELANSKNLTEKQKAFIESEIEALKQLISVREQDVQATKKAAQPNKEDSQKQLEQLQKLDKEKRDAQAAFAKFTFDEQNKNADKEAALRKQVASETIEEENKLQAAILAIDEETLKQKIKNGQDTLQPITDLEIQLTEVHIKQNELKKKSDKEASDALIKAMEDATEKGIEAEEKRLKAVQEAEKKKQEAIQETFDKISQSAAAFTDILNANTESQIQSLTDATQAQTDSFDKQQEHLQQLFDAHKISQKDFDKQSKALADNRAKAEKASQDKIKALKLEEAKREKELAVFTIGLDIAKHLSAIPTDFFGAALAAAQLIAVLAKPLPAFKKGTRGKHGSGMALVGEEGAELTFLPSGAKVLPAQRTKQYSDVIDSMFDGRLDDYIHKNYVLPALKLQSPNVNVNIDYKKLAKANKQRDSISIDNLHELADLFDHNPRRVI